MAPYLDVLWLHTWMEPLDVYLKEEKQNTLGSFELNIFIIKSALSLSIYQVISAVSSIPLPTVSSRGTPLIPQLLHDHLVHHRCPETAAIIARDLLRGPQVRIQDTPIFYSEFLQY